ncbi:branched-chain amino acid transport system II carrier protein, partial [Collinsella intestinalis]|uniref:branched-chain amino acid transport system II carrier protein n=1 Tax=Collinsella intestinalis TaxID=147207 RepID=UPI00241C235A
MTSAKLTSRQSLFVGVTLFSMFFGAGNLIIPPLLGLQAGGAVDGVLDVHLDVGVRKQAGLMGFAFGAHVLPLVD